MHLFSSITSLISQFPAFDEHSADAARTRQQSLTKPAGSLGVLEDLAVWLAGWQGCAVPQLGCPCMVVFAGNHGVVAQGVSAYPAEVTAQMVENFARGGAAINQLCDLNGIALSVIPLNLDTPAADFTTEPSLGYEAFERSFQAGRAAVPESCDLLMLGEMGIGNTTAAAAVMAGLLGMSGAEVAGPGTGLDRVGVARKAAVIDRGLERHRAQLGDPLEVLRCFGGYELAAISGAVLEARLRRIPVLLDGFVVTAAAAPLRTLRGDALQHCWAGHCSAEPSHRRLLGWLGLQPLLELGMRLGEGSGAAVAYSLVLAALATHAGMASFASAGVSAKA